MSDINIDTNTYYPSGNITIFPSSNAVDAGKIWTEFNGRNITINITDLNYVVSPNPGGYDISFNSETNNIDIQPGKAIINGFEVDTNIVVSYRLPTADEISNEGYYQGYALLCLHTIFDSMNNLSGNVQVGSTWYCEGIRVEYVSYTTYNENPSEYLLLGGVKEDGEVKINKDKYARIDAKYILVKLEEDPETHVPPTQSTDLLTFINNYLKGYWVSKAGDNEYGQLLFKTMPDGYLAEGFDYNTEDSLDSSKFGVKIVGKGKGILTVKGEEDNDSNPVSQIEPGMIFFYTGQYKEDNGLNFTESDSVIYNSSLPVSAYGDNNHALFIATVGDNGAIILKQLSGNGPILVVETNTNSHNGVEQGNVIYANATGSKINQETTDTTNKYEGNLNYLIDKNGSIASKNGDNEVSLNGKDLLLTFFNVDYDTPGVIQLVSKNFDTDKIRFVIYTGNENFNKENNNLAWKNVFHLADNLKVSGEVDATNNPGGSIQATGFIVAGNADEENPAAITVPDIANGGTRTLKSGDILGSQVWSAVYNDYAEVFRIHKEDKDKIQAGCVLAVDKLNPDYYVLSDNKNNCVVGVVSENPAYCAGGDDCEYGVPVALAGRVKVKYCKDFETIEPEIGDWVTASKTTPGFCTTAVNRYTENILGKIIKIIDQNTVEIIVSLK